MAGDVGRERLYMLFADILAYPGPGLAEAARECEAALSLGDPDAAAQLGEFRRAVEETPVGRMEEIYTGTFDLDASCYPYIGYHLFGESYKRSVFLVGLRERYQARGFTADGELPDHLAVMLRFLATNDDADLTAELIQDALLPSLGRMIGESEDAQEPPARSGGRDVYRWVLRALRLVLGQPRATEAVATAGH